MERKPVGWLQEKILKPLTNSVEIVFPYDRLHQTAFLIAEGHPIIIAGNHQSHADIIPLAMITRQIMEAANGLIATGGFPRTEPLSCFLTPMAVTVTTGGQTPGITRLFQTINPWLVDNGVILKSVTREKDMTVSKSQPLPSTISPLKNLLRAPENNQGLAVLLSGTVDEGRRASEKGNERKGMKKIGGKNLFTRVLQLCHQQGSNPVILPIGFSETYNMFDPDSRKPTPQVIKAYGHNVIHPKRSTILASATVGQPIIAEDIWQGQEVPEGENIHVFWNNLILGRIAQLIPYESRGEFK